MAAGGASSPRALAITITGLGVCAVSIVWFSSVLLPFVIAWVLAFLLNPMASRLEHRFHSWLPRGDSRLSAVIALYLLGIALILAIGVPLLVSLVSNALSLADRMSVPNVADYRQAAVRLLDKYKECAGRLPYADEVLKTLKDHQDQLISTTGLALQKIGQQTGTLLRKLSMTLIQVGAGTANLALVPIVLFYMLYDYRRISASAMSLVPRSHLPVAERLLAHVDRILGGFIRGQLTIALFAACFYTTGLALIGVQYALFLGPFAGMVNFIPYLGAFGLLPAAAVAVVQCGFTLKAVTSVGLIVVVCVLWNVVEGLLLQPRLIGEALALHPLIVLLALALGGQAAGLQGLILAVPVAAVGKAIWEEARGALYGPELQ